MFENGFPRGWSTFRKLALLFRSVVNAVVAVLKTVTGAIIHITDALAKPAVDLKITFSPAQDLHGYDNPWPAGGGENLYNYPSATRMNGNGITTTLADDGTITVTGLPSNTYLNALDYVDITDILVDGEKYRLLNTTTDAALNLIVRARGTNATTAYYGAVGGYQAGFTVDKTTYDIGYDIFLQCRKASWGEESRSAETKVMLAKRGSDIPAWSPFSNICPISGYTGLTLSHSGADMSNPTTYPISWQSEAGTVYGGTLDVTTGLLTVTHANIASYNGESVNEPWLSSMDGYVAGATPTTGAQVVYPLDEPQTFQLTATEITLLLGENNLWTDANGDLTLTYYADGRASDAEALGILLGNRYVNNHEADEPSDREALEIILGGSTR